MLQPLTTPSQLDQDESLLTIIGFLEACLPRVRELIEAGMTGALAEDTVVKCLTVNDSLCQVLEFVEHPETCQGDPAVDKETKEPQLQNQNQVDGSVDNFDAFGIGDDDDDDLFGGVVGGNGNGNGNSSSLEKKPAADKAVENDSVKAATSALDDLLLVPTPMPMQASNTGTSDAAAVPVPVGGEGVVTPVPAPAAVVKDEMDEFDDFFNDRHNE